MAQRILVQDSPGVELPGLDFGRIVSQVNDLWDAYGGLVLAVVAVLVVVAACYVVVRVVRRVPVNRLIALVAVVPTLVWTSHGVWNVTVNALGMSPGIAVFAFLVFEAMLVNAGYEAEAHRRRFGTPGPHGRYVWVIALTTGTVASLGDPTLVGSVARFVLPLVAAGLWWTTLTAPRPSDTPEMIAARERRARGRSTVWAITPRTVLVAAGLMRPGDEQSMSEAERERRIRRMVVLADRVHSAPAGGRAHRRASARLRRLARLATAEDVAEARARMARAVGVVTEVVPAAESPAGNQGSQPDPRQRESRTRTDDRADHAGATAPRRQRNRPRTALHTPAGARPGHVDAHQTWLASLQQGRPLSGGELGRLSGVDASTGRRWVRSWRAELDTTPTDNDAASGVNGNGK
ncbi:MAG: hypothetical protein ACRDT6_11235 [Micromonosporaceae bacterium]